MASTVAIKGAWSLQSTNDALSGRFLAGLLLALDGASATSLGTWKSGVVTTVSSGGQSYDLWVQQQVSPNMSVFVFQGYGIINRAGQGPYVAYCNTQPTLTVAAASPSLPRIDLVYLQVLDNALGDGSTLAQVGIVTGTPAGSPTVPSLPVGGVSIPLAQVAVAANATSITQANITDVRQSGGINGPPRLLLPGDSTATAGRRAGEERQRVLASYSNFLSTDYWGIDAAWHGTSELIPPSYTWLNGSSNITINTSNTGLISVAIPDPGWAYKLRVSGQIDFGSYGTFTAGAAPFCQGFVTLTTVTGTVLSQGNGFAQSAAGLFDGWTSIPVKPSGVLTGAQTVFLVAKGSVAMNSAFVSFTNNATVLNVDVVPV